VYSIVLFGVVFLTLVGDIGLGASLVQSREEPEDADYQAVFTGQVALYAILAGTAFVLAPAVVTLFAVRPDAEWLIRLMAVALLIASFRAVPTARMERHLRFGPLALAETVEVAVFQGLAIAMASQRLGPFSLGLAFVASQLVAALPINCIERWPMAWRFDWRRIRGHLGFGLRYQG